MDIGNFLQGNNYIIYAILLAIIAYLAYQINTKDYSNKEEYFSADIPLHRFPPPQVIINMKNLQFNPNYVIIPVNTEVLWINLDIENGVTHNCILHSVVESSKGLFASQKLATNESFSFKFNRPGTYKYFCPYYKNMNGTIVVTDETTM